MPATIRNSYAFAPIGLVHTSAKWRYEAPRQAEFSSYSACIDLYPGMGFEDALADLAGFQRIWVIFVFHLNATWRPKVSPPYAPEHRKYGVFATRSPHRPNPIGLSCVELAGIDGLKICLKQCDILDRTPVLDIKPYIPMADSFPDSKAGWRDALNLREWHHVFSPIASLQADWICRETSLDLLNFCEVQLRYNPFDTEKKRIEQTSSGWTIHCRTWSIDYTADESASLLQIVRIRSNYSADDLLPGAPDPHADKDFHRRFLEVASWK